MASNYPTGLDSFPTSHVDGVGEIVRATDINNLADATNKIEAELGVNPSGTYTDIAAAIAAASSGPGGLPSSFVDVTNSTVMGSNVLADDMIDAGTGTDNSTALNNAINLVPTSGYGRATTFLFPIKNRGRYGFGSTVTISGGRAIRFVGSGASAAHDGHYMSVLAPLNNSITMFDVTGSGALQQQGPSFENFYVANNSKTSVRGLYVHQTNRVHLRNMTFADLNIGVELNEDGFDCAYHEWHNVQFYACNTGLLSTASNSWNWVGGRLTGNVIGIDGYGLANFTLFGCKIDTPLSGTPIGIRTQGYASSFYGLKSETGNWSGAPIIVQVNYVSTSTQGTGNFFEFVGHNGGSTANSAVLLDLSTGTVANFWSINWAATNSSQPVVRNAGTANRPRGGVIQDTLANRPISYKYYQGQFFLQTDGTRQLWVCDGTSWRLVGATT